MEISPDGRVPRHLFAVEVGSILSRPGPFAHQDSPRMSSIGRSRHRQWRRLPINGSSFSAACVLLCPLPIGESVLECVILDVVDGVADRPGGDNPVAEP